ncbi:MAG: triose-phosphate isomerase [Candidatus Diapherotrites archaeon]
MSRSKVIVGNWKMNLTITEGKKLVEELHKYAHLHIAGTNVKVIVCPPYTHLSEIANVLKESEVKMGAQDCHYENNGAFTGDVSANMVAAAGAQYCIIGHSERRANYHEPNRIINAKVLAALRSNMTPILCVGETAAEKKEGKTFEVLGVQLNEGLAGISRDQITKVILAYEPVWAISTSKDNTGQPATPKDANDAHAFLRDEIKKQFGADEAQRMLILYGGSVKPENARLFLTQNDIDGCLVGGASLKKDSFIGIIDAANIPQ